MSQKAPRSLVRALTVLLILSFATSMYLEQRHLQWLQAHPISVNLMSGVVGFSATILVVALVFNWFAERERVASLVKEAVDGLRREIEPHSTTIDHGAMSLDGQPHTATPIDSSAADRPGPYGPPPDISGAQAAGQTAANIVRHFASVHGINSRRIDSAIEEFESSLYGLIAAYPARPALVGIIRELDQLMRLLATEYRSVVASRPQDPLRDHNS
ncbi:hypothetical protein [Catellatospora chokoriensis]|uniref:Uncharacterized protein n=1 Tax=Catellatospora chokoriensis TaxID=310353 RepID=A0A8J3K696_9ACTN|nr:hypothetical protein [Catellatospora chokoriensis]GIF94829.1 hypothetical protein Cch02nite_82730 [Catellatospora chokoriensis]